MTYDANFWRTLMLASAALGQTIFVILYLTFPWYKDFLGRSLFGMALSLALVMDIFILGRLIGFGSNDVLFAVLYFLLSGGVWSQVFAFVRVKFRRQVSGNGEPE